MSFAARLASVLLASVLSVGALAAQKTPTFVFEGYAPEQGKFFVEGKAANVSLKGAKITKLGIVYRPSSQVSEPDSVEAVNGVVSWTPKAAGLVKLTAFYEVGGEEKKIEDVVSVAFASFFTLGVVIMVVAGILLFGGAFLSIRALLRSESE